MTLVLPGSRLLHLLEAALALWVAAWIALGVAVAVNVKQFVTLSETVEGRPRDGDGRRVAALARERAADRRIPKIGQPPIVVERQPRLPTPTADCHLSVTSTEPATNMPIRTRYVSELVNASGPAVRPRSRS